MSPIIAVSTSRQHISLNYSASQDLTFSNNSVINILVSLGCIPLLIPNALAASDCHDVLSHIDGLVLSSGQDIAPEQYGQQGVVEYDSRFAGTGEAYRRPLILRPDPDRDRLEIALYRGAVARAIPVVGLCRGMQLINVAEGGTLHQEVPDNKGTRHQIDRDGWMHCHDLDIVPGTRLHHIVQDRRINISSVHHQGIDRLAPGLIANSHAGDGLIEGIEKMDGFVIGLQGHFERSLENQPANIKVWNAFAHHAFERKP